MRRGAVMSETEAELGGVLKVQSHPNPMHVCAPDYGPIIYWGDVITLYDSKCCVTYLPFRI